MMRASVAAGAIALWLLAVPMPAPATESPTGDRNYCKADVEGLPPGVYYKHPVDRVVAGYFSHCMDRTTVTLGAIYSAERRNPVWADPLEAKINEVAESSGLNSLTMTGDCRASLCRYDVKLSPADLAAWKRTGPHMLGLLGPVTKAHLSVGGIERVTPTGFICLFYSGASPAFLEPFRSRMEEEAQAITAAESFVARHGYTAAGHPADQPVEQVELLDIGRSDADLVRTRRDTLEPHAFGIGAAGPHQYNVLFHLTHAPGFRVVVVKGSVAVQVVHSTPAHVEWIAVP